jgi:uncharacterized DUF497 family protein
MVITWDNAKRLANLAKHGLDFASLDVEFFANALVGPARSPRFVAIGRRPDGVVVTVIFARLGTEALSVISMRRASQKERNRLNGP